MPYKDKEKQLEAQRKHYKENKQRYLNNQYQRRMEKARWFFEYKESLACKECGENHPACIQFHHRNPSEKHRAVSEMVNAGYSKEAILEEIEKCDVVCANCHLKYHWQENVESGLAKVSPKYPEERN